MNYRYSNHALKELQKRKIPKGMVDKVMRKPGRKVPEYGNLHCYQSKIAVAGKTYILRVMVNENVTPWLIVTVYKTGKIEKYWR